MKEVKTIEELRKSLSATTQTTVLGFFDESHLLDEQNEGYSVDPWNQYVAAADALRG